MKKITMFLVALVALLLISDQIGSVAYANPDSTSVPEPRSKITLGENAKIEYVEHVSHNNTKSMIVHAKLKSSGEKNWKFYVEPEHPDWWTGYRGKDNPITLTTVDASDLETTVSINMEPVHSLFFTDELTFHVEEDVSLFPAKDAYKQTIVVDRPAGIDNAEAYRLAYKYLPVLKLDKIQPWYYSFDPLGGVWSFDPFVPKDIKLFLRNATLKKRKSMQEDAEIPLGKDHPDSLDLYMYAGSDLYLDLPGDPGAERSTYCDEATAYYSGVETNYPNTAYVTIMKDDANDLIIISYWFFYYLNDHHNVHDGDWEGINIFLDQDENPLWAVYSQHEKKEARWWQNVEKLDGHPVVYVANGSHASYFDAGNTYGTTLVVSILPVPFRDFHFGQGIWLMPSSVQILSSGSYTEITHWGSVQILPRFVDLNANTSNSWINFSGRWGGTYAIGGRKPVPQMQKPLGVRGGVQIENSSPIGPAYKGDRWTDPYEWAKREIEELPPLPQQPPSLSLNGYNWDDPNGDDDGVMEAREKVRLQVQLRSTRNIPNVNAVLRTSDPKVNITDSAVYYQSFSAEELQWSVDWFDMNLNFGLAKGQTRTSHFTLHITYQKGGLDYCQDISFNKEFSWQGEHVLFAICGFTIDDSPSICHRNKEDGIFQSSEEIDIRPLLCNKGTANASGISLSVFYNGKVLQVPQQQRGYSDLAPGDRGYPKNNRYFRICSTDYSFTGRVSLDSVRVICNERSTPQ